METTSNQKQLFGHPIGLYILFFTEMWERFSYYGMRALLVLFMTAPVAKDGLGWSQGDAISLYGTYTMMVYLMSIPGGILADKLLGQKRSVMIGGLTLVAGHLVMAIPEIWAFYTALVLIVLGVGMLKPNISTMVGGLYAKGDPNRDQGFNIFYLGINIGAFASSIAVGLVAEKYGWHYGFGLAGIGMLLGQLVFMAGQKHLKGVGDLVGGTESKISKEEAERPLTKVEKDRMIVLLISFLIVIVFWGAFEQAGGLMNLWAQNSTDRTFGLLGLDVIPAAWFQSVNALFIMMFVLAIGYFWAMRAKSGKETSTLLKMAVGTMIMGAGFLFMSAAAKTADVNAEGGYINSSMTWLVLAYLFHTIGELCVSPTALSFITKLSPAKYASIMMGLYFAATGLGNKVAGLVGEAAVDGAGEFEVFTGIAIFAIAFGLLLLVFFKKLKKLTHGAEDVKAKSLEKEITA
ncbi:peptide MFS transporter [Sediminitomix flava]|uniref:POT family proton-dependent oligopeptide transporter n=1 Tax=Sediminitomix flava TaxID=379075 RepID=A0A315ZC46_SEDFL|nr:peptide MFS transporter [Sediminitomix flava]PWJ42378.1 POT family proton-dependent oligopeptide transporter [Sediminitomix flava]